MDLSAYASEFSFLHDKTALLFSKEPCDSDYVGTSYHWESAGTARCSVHQVTDKLTIEQYGPRVYRMRNLCFDERTEITEGMGVSLTPDAEEPDYTVVSVMTPLGIPVALIEVIAGGG